MIVIAAYRTAVLRRIRQIPPTSEAEACMIPCCKRKTESAGTSEESNCQTFSSPIAESSLDPIPCERQRSSRLAEWLGHGHRCTRDVVRGNERLQDKTTDV